MYPPMYGVPPTTSDDIYKFYKRMKKLEKEDKGGDKKKDDKKQGLLKSPFTALQWVIILCTLGPITVPWYILAVTNSWNTAAAAIKASLN